MDEAERVEKDIVSDNKRIERTGREQSGRTVCKQADDLLTCLLGADA